MAASLQTELLAKLGLGKQKFNSIVHAGHYPAPETTRGVPRKLDFFDLVGLYVLAGNLNLGMSTPLAGRLATNYMEVLRN